jgi:hypothetical protein
MQPKDRPEFVTVIAALAATFGREATEPLLTGYWLGLQDISLAAVKCGAVAAMHQTKFLPSVAELRELCGEISPEARAVKAWAAVHEAMLRHDYYATVAIDDPFAAATIRNLWRTWAGFCEELERTDEKWLRKDFERVYAALWRAGISADEARPLLGAHDLGNGPKGYSLQTPVAVAIGLPAPPPRLIGGGARSADRRAIDGVVLQIAAETLKGI